RGEIAAVLRAEWGASLLGRSEGIESFVGPVLEHRSERRTDQVAIQSLKELPVPCAIARVVETPEHIDGAIMIGRAEDLVEVYRAVEEVPGDVAHQRAQKSVDRDSVRAARPGDVCEVLVAFEIELAERERFIPAIICAIRF